MKVRADPSKIWGSHKRIAYCINKSLDVWSKHWEPNVGLKAKELAARTCDHKEWKVTIIESKDMPSKWYYSNQTNEVHIASKPIGIQLYLWSNGLHAYGWCIELKANVLNLDSLQPNRPAVKKIESRSCLGKSQKWTSERKLSLWTKGSPLKACRPDTWRAFGI